MWLYVIKLKLNAYIISNRFAVEMALDGTQSHWYRIALVINSLLLFSSQVVSDSLQPCGL